MHIAHEKVFVTDLGDSVFFLATSVNGYSFTKCVLIAYDNTSVRALVAEVLRFGSHDNIGIQNIVFSQGDISHESDVVEESSTRPDFCIWSYHAKRADFDIDVDFCSRINPGVCCYA